MQRFSRWAAAAVVGVAALGLGARAEAAACFWTGLGGSCALPNTLQQPNPEYRGRPDWRYPEAYPAYAAPLPTPGTVPPQYYPYR